MARLRRRTAALPGMLGLVTGLLSPVPATRLTVEGVLAHPALAPLRAGGSGSIPRDVHGVAHSGSAVDHAHGHGAHGRR
jgi:hypothetical protein